SHRTRGNRVRRDAIASPLLCECLSEPDHSPLRCAIRTSESVSLQPRNRGDVDYTAAAALDHVRQRILRAKKRAGQVDGDSAVPVLEADLWNERGRPGDSGVVY